MRRKNVKAVAMGLVFWGVMSSLNVNAQGYWYNWWWPPRLVEENIRTDTFKGQIASITNSTITVKGQEVRKHIVRWSYAYPYTTPVQPSTPPLDSRYQQSDSKKQPIPDQQQTFAIPPSCRIFGDDGTRLLVGKLEVGKTATVKYSSQAKGNPVANEITVETKP